MRPSDCFPSSRKRWSRCVIYNCVSSEFTVTFLILYIERKHAFSSPEIGLWCMSSRHLHFPQWIIRNREFEPKTFENGYLSSPRCKIYGCWSCSHCPRWGKWRYVEQFKNKLTYYNFQHFRTNTAAVLLKPAPLQSLDSGNRGTSKDYYVLALVDSETKFGKHGLSLSCCCITGTDDKSRYWSSSNSSSLASNTRITDCQWRRLRATQSVINKHYTRNEQIHKG